MFGWRITVAAALFALILGIWGGNAWRKGQTAIAQAKDLKAQRDADRKAIADLTAAAQQLRQHAVDGALAYQQAAERINAIAADLERDRETNRQFAAQQQQALAALAAARPDLRGLRLGADVLQHWQQSNQGADPERAPAPAPAGATGQPAHPVPAAPRAGQRRGAGLDRQSRPGDGPVPRLQRARAVAGANDGRVAAHGQGLVLRGLDRRKAARRWV